jgi:hypothetical protein
MRQRLELPLRQNICVMNQARQLDLVHLIHLSRRPPQTGADNAVLAPCCVKNACFMIHCVN